MAARKPARVEPDRISAIRWPVPHDYQTNAKFQRAWPRAAAQASRTLERAIEVPVGTDGRDVGIVAAYDDLLRRCRGAFPFLQLLVDQGSSPARPAQEIWFQVGLAAAAVGRFEVTEFLGQHLQRTVGHQTSLEVDYLPPGVPPGAARAQHLLARASAMRPKIVRKFARAADAYYTAAGFPTPAELEPFVPDDKASVRKGRRLAWVSPGLAWPLIKLRVGMPNEHALIVVIGGAEREVTAEQLGMHNRRSGGVNAQWSCLQQFAREFGAVKRPTGHTLRAEERQVQLLGQQLSGLFGIEERPFEIERINRVRYWRAKFDVEYAGGFDGSDVAGDGDTLS